MKLKKITIDFAIMLCYVYATKTKGDGTMKNCSFYSIEEHDYASGNGVKKFYGYIVAKTPKEAVSKYLLYYWMDKNTIKYVKRAVRKQGSNFAVTDTARNRTSYYIIM